MFQRFIKSQRGFSNAGAGAGYTFYPLSYLVFSLTAKALQKEGVKPKVECDLSVVKLEQKKACLINWLTFDPCVINCANCHVVLLSTVLISL